MRGQECLAPCGRPAIDGDLNQCFFDLVDGHAARNRRIRINSELLKATQSGEDAKRQNTSCLLVKSGTTPCVAPSQFGNGSLKRHHEVIRARKVRVNILSAEYLLPRLETLL